MYDDLRKHITDRFNELRGEWVVKNSNYEIGLCHALVFGHEETRHWDAKWGPYTIELKKGKKANKQIEKHLLDTLILNLRKKISEFRELHNYLGKRALPKIVFWPHEHQLHFKPGIKQKWVKPGSENTTIKRAKH